MNGGTTHSKKTTVAVIGGDDRELVLIEKLLNEGFVVNVFGFPEELLPEEINFYSAIDRCMEDVDVIIFPMPGVNNQGVLYAKYINHQQITMEDFATAKPGALLLIGVMSQYFRDLTEFLNLKIIETIDMDAIAIPNAIPTAEGAIELAITESNITLHGSKVLIIGYGRVGEALALRLKGLQADVAVINRGQHRVTLAKAHGLSCYGWEWLDEIAQRAEFIFNTVPTKVLDSDLIAKLKRNVVIIDLSSSPGGVDLESAEKMGLRAILATGLPGKVAPYTAGKTIANIYPSLIKEHLQLL